MKAKFAVFAVLIILMTLCSPRSAFAADKSTASPSAPDAAYRESFEKWKAQQLDDLKKNWLTLAGLFWLKPGANSVGTDPHSVVTLPEGSAAAKVGSFQLQGDAVTVRFLPAAAARIDGKSVTESALQPDVSGKPTVIELGSLRMFVIKRGERIGIRVRDLNSPAVRKFAGMTFFPLDMNYRVTAKWLPSDGKKTVNVPNVLGDTTAVPIAGEVRFKVNGRELQLTALGGDASKGVSFVFSDLTSKTDTYPGGRFLETGPIVDGTVVLDFNRAYNPPCAVTPYATCPLAPKENRLSAAVPAGEKYDHTHGHH